MIEVRDEPDGNETGGVSDALRRCWADPTPSAVNAFYRRWPVPGSPALRSRYETLADVPASSIDGVALYIGSEQWQEQIALATAGDTALHLQDVAAAVTAFDALAASHRQGQHPLPLIETATGRGDIARQAGDAAAAQRHYERALTLARTVRARYAEIRAGTALGYVQLRDIGASSARESFRRAEQVAREGGWLLERANALIGLGECDSRQRRVLAAHRHLLAALDVFDSIGSRQGVVNALTGLGDACRMVAWGDDAHGWFSQALTLIAKQHEPGTLPEHSDFAPGVIARVNALEGLAEAEIRRGDIATARRHLGEAARISLAVDYRVGFAHALQGLGNAAFAAGYATGALGRYARARDAYERLDLPTGVADASTGVARAADALGEVGLELLARAESVRAIETARSRQVRDVDQEEYLGRHGHHYSLALIAAIRHGDIELFIATFEALAGRRLAGLRDAVLDPDGVRYARFAAQVAQSFATPHAASQDIAPDPDPEKERRRRLGRLALGAASPAVARAAFDDVAAGAYAAFDQIDAARLWEQVTNRHTNVVVLCESHDGSQLFWLAASQQTAAPHAGVIDIPEDTAALIDSLHRSGLSPTARLTELSPLASLLPAELRQALPVSGSLALVPAGRLWSIPWPAVTVSEDGRVLGECFAVTHSPTLTLLDQPLSEALSDPNRLVGGDGPWSVAWWCSTGVIHHRVEAFNVADTAYVVMPLVSGELARGAVLEGHVDLLVLVTHGRPAPEMVHTLDLDDAIPLTPAHLLAARTPRRLALIACWGAGTPGRRRSDPLSIATMALLRGSVEVLATTSELLDDAVASRFVNQILFRSLTQSFPSALQDSTVGLLAIPQYRRGPVARWAPLICLGTGTRNG